MAKRRTKIVAAQPPAPALPPLEPPSEQEVFIQRLVVEFFDTIKPRPGDDALNRELLVRDTLRVFLGTAYAQGHKDGFSGRGYVGAVREESRLREELNDLKLGLASFRELLMSASI